MIHFNLTDSRNYHSVQNQLLDLIKVHLPEGAWTEGHGYVDGKLNFSLFIHQKSDVLMSHGAADKNYHFRKDPEDKTLRLSHTLGRTDLLVPGPWMKRRLSKSRHLNFDENSVHIVGWPRLDPFFNNRRPAAEDPAPQPRRKRILWAPTHDFIKPGPEEGRLSSYPDFQPFFDKLSETYDAAVSLHPRNRKEKTPTGMALMDADVVVTDFGTMVYEAVALGKQVIFPHWLIGERLKTYITNSAENVIFQKEFGLHAHSFDEMRDMIESGRQMDERARAFFEDYLPPETYGKSGKMIADVLLHLAAQKTLSK